MRKSLAVAVLAAALGAGDAAADRPRTLVQVPHRIVALVHDGDRIGWAGCSHIYVRRLSKGSTVRMPWRCNSRTHFRRNIVLAGRRLLWREVGESRRDSYDVAVTMTVGGTRARRLQPMDFRGRSWFAGDGATLVFGESTYNYLCPPSLPCAPHGGVWRVTGGSVVAIPGTPPPVGLAAAAGRVASAPARVVNAGVLVGPESVQVRDARTGTLRMTVFPTGDVREVALSARTLAVLVSAEAGLRLEWYAVPSGDWLGSTPAPANIANLDIGRGRIVYRSDNEIRLVNTRTGVDQLLWVARSEPIGLSIEGRRVAWATNASGGRRGRVLTFMLPL